MAYKALYRTYRPQKFSEVVGQEIVTKTLQNSIANQKISHAYLFCGPRGTGKTSVARIFAKALNCPNQVNNEPCNNCQTCEEITNGINPNVIEIDAASNNGVDEIRELKDKVKFLPAGARYKIYIIDEVHMLSTSAFNALLKTLEEPPSHAIFILATTEPHKVLPTIVSRCQRYDFKSLANNEILEKLKEVCSLENIKYEEKALLEISKSCDGGMRDALSYLDQAISYSDDIITEKIVSSVTGTIDNENLINLAKYIENKNVSESLKIIHAFQDAGRIIDKILNCLLCFYRDILVITANFNNNYSPDLIDFANTIDINKVYYNIDVLSNASNKIKFSNTPDIYLEVAIIKMINASSDDLDYGKRLNAIEEKLNNGDFGSSDGSVDGKRLRILEEKFNNLLTELSKLELVKLIERVKYLELNNNTNSNNVSSVNDEDLKQLKSKTEKLNEDVELLKMLQNSMKNQVENLSLGGINESYLNDKIEESTKKIKPEVNFNEIQEFIKKEIGSNSSDLNQEALDQKIKLLENKISEYQFSNSGEVNTELLDRINLLEEKANTLNSLNNQLNELKNELANKSFNDSNNEVSIDANIYNKINELESKISSLNNTNYDDKINALESKLSNASNTNSNNNYNELLQRVEQLENVKQTSSKTDLNVDDRLDKIESNVYKLMSGMLTREPVKKSKKKVDDKQISIWQDQVMPVNKIQDLKENTRVDFGDLAIEQHEQQENLFVETKKENVEVKHEVIEEVKPVVKEVIQEAKPVIEESKEVKEVSKPLNNFENINTINNNVIENNVNNVEVEENSDLDEYERYDVKVLERIMNDARNPEYTTERERIMSLWRHLDALAPLEKRGVAEMLKEGEVKAVGNHEFVLIYDKALNCNNVMNRKFKRNSLKLLYDLLGSDYNYFAIPKTLWFEKRQEYSNQYSVGVAFPTLSPINDPSLKVANEDEVSESDQAIRKMYDIFGTNINIKRS